MNDKKTFIRDIREKEHVTGAFLVTRKESGVSKNGKAYLTLKIMDSTGELEARIWDDAEELGRKFQKNDVVNLKGFAVAYQGGVQVNVSAIAALKEGDYSIRDFLPASKKDPKKMMEELDRVISSIKDVHIKALLESIFKDGGLRASFMDAPAAKTMHHPYLGGLLEHVLSICGLAEKVTAHYGAAVNKDLLTAGAILHDIGKIYELSFKRSFDYTDEGRLVGHITLGVELLDKKISELKDFPRELSVLLKHMLLSHHGHLEFGSPKRPKTIEALILYYLDDLDAKINAIMTLKENSREGEPWTPYQKLFERYIYTGEYRSVEEGPAPEKEEGEKEETEKGELSLFK